MEWLRANCTTSDGGEQRGNQNLLVSNSNPRSKSYRDGIFFHVFFLVAIGIELVDHVANAGRHSKVLENSNDGHINLSPKTCKLILCKSSLREKKLSVDYCILWTVESLNFYLPGHTSGVWGKRSSLCHFSISMTAAGLWSKFKQKSRKCRLRNGFSSHQLLVAG